MRILDAVIRRRDRRITLRRELAMVLSSLYKLGERILRGDLEAVEGLDDALAGLDPEVTPELFAVVNAQERAVVERTIDTAQRVRWGGRDLVNAQRLAEKQLGTCDSLAMAKLRHEVSVAFDCRWTNLVTIQTLIAKIHVGPDEACCREAATTVRTLIDVALKFTRALRRLDDLQDTARLWLVS